MQCEYDGPMFVGYMRPVPEHGALSRLCCFNIFSLVLRRYLQQRNRFSVPSGQVLVMVWRTISAGKMSRVFILATLS